MISLVDPGAAIASKPSKCKTDVSESETESTRFARDLKGPYQLIVLKTLNLKETISSIPDNPWPGA